MAERGDIDRVREASDLVDLIAEVTKVKKSGRSYAAICPFHEEKTPSMSVDRARGLYHCFGCGKGGDVFTFVQETQGVDFGEAIELLARKAGITLVRDPEDAKRRGKRGAAVEAIRRAIDFYHQRLKKAPEAGPARAYLRSRGYAVDLIDEWRLGFAGVDWDTLTKDLKAGGVADQAMLDGGLSRRGRHGLFDVFRGRLMFPIHDLRGDPDLVEVVAEVTQEFEQLTEGLEDWRERKIIEQRLLHGLKVKYCTVVITIDELNGRERVLIEGWGW